MPHLITGLIAAAIGLGLRAARAAAEKLRVVASLPDVRRSLKRSAATSSRWTRWRGATRIPTTSRSGWPSLWSSLRRADLSSVTASTGIPGSSPWCGAPATAGSRRGARDSSTSRAGSDPRRSSRGRGPLAGRRPPRGEPALHARPGQRRHRGDEHPGGARSPRPRAPGPPSRRGAGSGWAASTRPSVDGRRPSPHRGARVVTNHDLWIYFLDRFGLVAAGTVEDRPGLPLARARGGLGPPNEERAGPRRGLRAIRPEADRPHRPGDGVQAIGLASAVGREGRTSYLDLFDFNVRALAQALR